MKLMSLLNVIDDQERVLVWDDNKPIDVPPLFRGKVKDCKCHRSIGNGIVKMIIPRERPSCNLYQYRIPKEQGAG